MTVSKVHTTSTVRAIYFNNYCMGLMMEAVRTSETLVAFSKTTWLCILMREIKSKQIGFLHDTN
jgi:hypothetical protein